jgi:hypothetical protein
MMDAIVQLYRNGICCVKDLGLFPSSFLYDPLVTASYYEFPSPLNKTHPMDALISLGQAYAFFSTTQQGWKMMTHSYGKINRINRLLETRGGPVKTQADRLVNASLLKEMSFAIRSLFIGVNVFFIGLAFFWLVGNSWHVTETDWIGGVQAVINALTVMEVCLVPLLYYMWKDAGEQFAKAARMELLAEKMKKGALKEEEMGLSSFETLSGWVPFWDAGVGLFEGFDSAKEEKLTEQEVAKVQETLKALIGKKGDDKKSDGKKGNGKKGDEKKGDDQNNDSEREAKANDLLAGVTRTRLEGYREYVYFVMNCVAFYGYLVGIIVYYWEDEMKQPAWIQQGLLLGMNNTHADWHGNFAGDLMWTIEPIIIMGSPSLFSLIKPKSSKIKAD